MFYCGMQDRRRSSDSSRLPDVCIRKALCPQPDLLCKATQELHAGIQRRFSAVMHDINGLTDACGQIQIPDNITEASRMTCGIVAASYRQ